MKQQRKVPLRKCVACQEMKPKKNLLRIVRTPEGTILIDITGKKSGRGAYLCGQKKCFSLAYKSNALERALSHKITSEIYEELEKEFYGISSATGMEGINEI